MASRRPTTFAVFLLAMVVALLAHASSQDGATIAAVHSTPVTGPSGTIHAPTFGDPEHTLTVIDAAAVGGPGADTGSTGLPPTCPDDRRAGHDDSGVPTPRLSSAGAVTVAVPAVFSEPVGCAAEPVDHTPDRSYPGAAAGGAALCTELCISRR